MVPASLHLAGEWKREFFCGGHGSDQVPEGTVIITTKNIVVKAIYLCCSSSHWMQRDFNRPSSVPAVLSVAVVRLL